MTVPTRHKGPQPVRLAHRGFVLLVVMMGVAALSVIVWLQTDTALGDRLASISVKQDTQARAIAERCLQEAVTYARSEVNRNSLQDFDSLLDPGTASTPGPVVTTASSWPATLFQAPGLPMSDGTTTIIHDAARTSADDEIKAMHRYTLVPFQNGACLIRFDDNQDDSLTSFAINDSLVSGNSTLPEGTGTGGAEEVRRDRDRAMMVTAIGIFPYNGTPLGAYQRARSRVTMRALLQTEISGSDGSGVPGLSIGGNVTPGVSVCGVVGGIEGNDSSSFSGKDMCGCGEMRVGATGAPSACPNGFCGSSDGAWAGNDCTAGTDTATSSAFTPSGPTMEWPADLSANMPTGFVPATPLPSGPGGGTAPYLQDGETTGPQWYRGNSGTLLQPLSEVPVDVSDDVCDFWFGNGAIGNRWVYYWDHTDDHADVTVGSGSIHWGLAVSGVSSHNNCTVKPSTLPAPCDWEPFSGTDWSYSVSCGTGESLCWKPAAYLGGNVANIGPIPTAGGTMESTDNSSNKETFKPRNDRAAPFAHDSPPAFSSTHKAALPWETLCGSITDNDIGAGGVRWTGGRWQIDGDVTAAHWGANGTRWWFEHGHGSADTVQINGNLGTDTTPLKLTIIAQNSIEIEGGTMNVICPRCSPLTGAGPFNRSDASKANGHFIWAPYGHCELGKSDRVVGHVTCRTVRLDVGVGDMTFVGDVTNLTYCPSGSCVGNADFDTVGSMTEHCFTSGNPCSSPGVCMQKDLTFIGDVRAHGDIQFDKTNVLAGHIVASHLGTDAASFGVGSRNSLCLKKKTTVSAEEFVFVGRDLMMNSSAEKIFTPKLYVANNIVFKKKNWLKGFGTGDTDVFVGNNINIASSGKEISIDGRVRLLGNFSGDSSTDKVVIRNNGGATNVVVNVKETTLWMEPSW